MTRCKRTRTTESWLSFDCFFSQEPTIEELGKLLHDQYEQVDFRLLEQQLRQSCAVAGCPVPRSYLHEALYGWVRDLRTSPPRP
jgi:hypothetical protein